MFYTKLNDINLININLIKTKCLILYFSYDKVKTQIMTSLDPNNF